MVSFLRSFAAALLCVFTVSGGELPQDTPRNLTDFRVESLEMTVPFPTDAYVTDRSVDADFPALERLGMTAQQLEVEYKKRNIHCNAIWFDENDNLVEIIVAMSEDEDSRAIFQLRDYDDYYMNALAESYAEYSEHGLYVSGAYTEASVVREEQAAYIRAVGFRYAEDAAEYHLHYMTVVNGRRIEITLVEHCTPEEGAGRVSVDNQMLMEQIIAELCYDGLDNEFVAKNRGYVVTSCVMLGLSALLVTAYFISKFRAQSNATADVGGTQTEEDYCSNENTTEPDHDS